MHYGKSLPPVDSYLRCCSPRCCWWSRIATTPSPTVSLVSLDSAGLRWALLVWTLLVWTGGDYLHLLTTGQRPYGIASSSPHSLFHLLSHHVPDISHHVPRQSLPHSSGWYLVRETNRSYYRAISRDGTRADGPNLASEVEPTELGVVSQGGARDLPPSLLSGTSLPHFTRPYSQRCSSTDLVVTTIAVPALVTTIEGCHSTSIPTDNYRPSKWRTFLPCKCEGHDSLDHRLLPTNFH